MEIAKAYVGTFIFKNVVKLFDRMKVMQKIVVNSFYSYT